MNKLVIATHNAKKAGEMITILSRRFPNLEIKTLADYKDAPEPEETGDTYAANAVIKAVNAAEFTWQWCAADDAGLEIDALHGQPGLHSKRFAGEETPFNEKMRIILDRMKDVPEEKRTARFRCWVALSAPDGTEVKDFEGICEGRIATEPSGGGGFGYDPIFYLPELKCTMADLTADQKHEISHRGKVLKKLGDYMQKRFFS